MIKKVDIDSNVLKEGLFDENQVNQLTLQFFHEILRLENNLKCQGESDAEKSLKDLTTLLEADLKECEKELNKIESRLNQLKALCGLEPDDLNIYPKIELKMNELCDLKEDEDLTMVSSCEKEDSEEEHEEWFEEGSAINKSTFLEGIGYSDLEQEEVSCSQ
ncbi:hypothetical protein POTOM_002879 [Populus tomentosa]|uniref:Uncharacterized protein n=1 Tax=Populus tomentosa TaxID=118781 RepID=A0A8X8DKI5_POPTO|nr:hypothetical protein POTOM_002879 [Populus tomentosa]